MSGNLHPANATGSPGSTMAGLAAMAPTLVDMVSNFTLPHSPVEWLQLVFGVLAVLFRS